MQKLYTVNLNLVSQLILEMEVYGNCKQKSILLNLSQV